MSARIPTYCEHCGYTWLGNEIMIGGNMTLSLKGNKTRCPSCGQMTPMLDGNFKIENGVLFLENGPQITLVKLEKIKASLQRFNDEATIEEVEKEIDSVAEEKGFLTNAKKWIEQNGASSIRTVTDIARLIDLLTKLF